MKLPELPVLEPWVAVSVVLLGFDHRDRGSAHAQVKFTVCWVRRRRPVRAVWCTAEGDDLGARVASGHVAIGVVGGEVSLNVVPAVCVPGFATVKPVAPVGDTVIVPEPLAGANWLKR